MAVLAAQRVIEVVGGEPDLSETENALDSPSQIRIGWGDCGTVIRWSGVGNWSRMIARRL